MSYRTILIDVDGTLLDSNDAHAKAWGEMFHRRGLTFGFDRLRPMMGMGGDKVLREVAGVEPEDPVAEAMTAERTAIFLSDHLPSLLPTRGAEALISRIERAALRPMVASSSGAELPQLLKRVGLERLAGDAVTSADAERSKPDPDIVLAALAKAGCRSEQALLIGGRHAVRRAGRAGGRCRLHRRALWRRVGRHLARRLDRDLRRPGCTDRAVGPFAARPVDTRACPESTA